MEKEIVKITQPDFEVHVNYPTIKKVTNSVEYPFKIFDRKETFPGFKEKEIVDASYEDIDDETVDFDNIQEIFSEQIDFQLESDFFAKKIKTDLEILITEQIDRYVECLEAYEKIVEYNADNPDAQVEWQGPSKEELINEIDEWNSILEGKNPDSDEKKKWLKGHVSALKVYIKEEPLFELGGKEHLKLKQAKLLLSGTGEIWVRYKWIKCLKYIDLLIGKICIKWKIVEKVELLRSINISGLKFKATAHVELKINEARIKVYGIADLLRLDYFLLNKIPLEKFVNKQINVKPVVVFDASVFIATLPVFKSNFHIKQVLLLESKDSLSIGLIINQV